MRHWPENVIIWMSKNAPRKSASNLKFIPRTIVVFLFRAFSTTTEGFGECGRQDQQSTEYTCPNDKMRNRGEPGI